MEWKDKKKGFIYITYALLLFFFLYRIRSFAALGKNLLGILFPFLVGGFLAFLLSLPMGWLERKLFPKEKSRTLYRFKRPISLALTFLLLIGIVGLVILMIVPALSDTVQKIIATVPAFLFKLVDDLKKWNLPVQDLEQWVNEAAINWSLIGEKVFHFLENWSTGFMTSTFGVVSSVVSGIADGVISLIFAIYLLGAKEKLYRQLKILGYAFLPEKVTDKVLRVGSLIHKTFSNFFAGQCMEACILGTMFMVFMAILRIPYAVLIGLLIALTALIPIFGAFIGCATGVILIVMVNPMKALLFLALFLILQQVEGNLIYPKVVGNSVGLPSIWVLVAVTTGASVMGILGMILFIPLFSVAYSLIREAAKKQLKKKHVSEEKYKN